MWLGWKQIDNVVQISSGPLQGRLRMDRQRGMVLVSMQANQSLLVEGSRHPGWIPFTIEHTDNFSEHRHFVNQSRLMRWADSILS